MEEMPKMESQENMPLITKEQVVAVLSMDKEGAIATAFFSNWIDQLNKGLETTPQSKERDIMLIHNATLMAEAYREAGMHEKAWNAYMDAGDLASNSNQEEMRDQLRKVVDEYCAELDAQGL